MVKRGFDKADSRGSIPLDPTRRDWGVYSLLNK